MKENLQVSADWPSWNSGVIGMEIGRGGTYYCIITRSRRDPCNDTFFFFFFFFFFHGVFNRYQDILINHLYTLFYINSAAVQEDSMQQLSVMPRLISGKVDM